jgi:hypothetical protein
MEALQRLHNRGSISTGYEIENSLKLETDNGEKLISSQFISAGNQKTWTVSFWVKITELGTNQMYWGSSDTYHYKGTDDKMYINFRGGSENFFLGTNRVFRDTSAWYHFVIVCDATNATNTDRGRLYINGVRETDYQLDTYNNMDGNDNTAWNGSNIHSVGGQNGSSNFDVSGYMAEFHSVDGQALDPTDFGEFDQVTGIWKPKEYTGSYGTNGFYLDFKNSLDLGDDISGNSKAFTNTNITSADQATDTPTNNFCIMNMLNRTNGNIKNQEGGTKVTTDGGSGWCSMLATMGVTKGKWYWESQRMSTGTPNDVITGIVGSEDAYIPFNTAANYYIGNVATSSSIGYHQKNYPSQEGSVINGVGLNFFSAPGDTIMFGLDMDNNKMYFGLNGTWLATNGADSIGGNPARASTLHADFDGEFVLPGVSVYQGNNMTINFGGYAAYTISSPASDANGYGTFEYAPPSGYYALCTKNLEELG